MLKLRFMALSLLLLSGCSLQTLHAAEKPAAEHSEKAAARAAEKVEARSDTGAKSADHTKNNSNASGNLTYSTPANQGSPSSTHADSQTQDTKQESSSAHSQSAKPANSSTAGQNQNSDANADDSIQVVANPASIPVLVNKQNKLPESYNPPDLVTTTVPFVSYATSEKRKMRREAASALAELFAGAKQDGISLLGVSGYRSHATQKSLFNYYVKVDGYAKARTYSALPGTSEHETGLSIDVTGGNGKCAASDCFGGTPEAKWLQAHVADYGFIIRYPNGKEAVTGYKYEPWHIRYVGKEIAQEIMGKGITLEEYDDAVPVNQ